MEIRDSIERSLQTAQRYWRETKSPLARVWLAISLRLYGKQDDALPQQDSRPSQDIALAALQALASSPENDRLFLPGAAAKGTA